VAGHKTLRQQEFMVQGVLAEAETLEMVVEAQEVSIPEAVVAEVDITLLQAVQADQVSSSLNTSPNLITKSSNHQAHGLHLVALLRSST
jgi:hypothetical protein